MLWCYLGLSMSFCFNLSHHTTYVIRVYSIIIPNIKEQAASLSSALEMGKRTEICPFSKVLLNSFLQKISTSIQLITLWFACTANMCSGITVEVHLKNCNLKKLQFFTVELCSLYFFSS